MTPAEKKEHVTKILNHFETVIHKGIDSGVDTDLTPGELIFLTVQVYFSMQATQAYRDQAGALVDKTIQDMKDDGKLPDNVIPLKPAQA